MTRSLLAAFAALVAVTTAGHAQIAAMPEPERPSLKSEATITGDIVRIGDLIDHAGIVASVPVFRSPDLGSTGTVSADDVLEAVRKHALIGVDARGVRDVVVTRASRAIPASAVEDAIVRTLATQFDLGSNKDIVVNFARDMRVLYVEPSAKGDLRVAHIDYDLRSGRFDATIEIPSAGGKRSIVQISGRATATVEIATAARTIDRGTVLRDADLIMERRPRAEVGRDAITKPSQAVGLAARSNLQPGRPIRNAELMKPDLVQRNDTVTIVYEVPGVVLTVRGKAADGGAEGDVINVINEQSKRTLQGVIVGPGRVAISNGSPRVASGNTTGSIANAITR
jgi:flagellar basal body P-ring formation protein FlgA